MCKPVKPNTSSIFLGNSPANFNTLDLLLSSSTHNIGYRHCTNYWFLKCPQHVTPQFLQSNQSEQYRTHRTADAARAQPAVQDLFISKPFTAENSLTDVIICFLAVFFYLTRVSSVYYRTITCWIFFHVPRLCSVSQLDFRLSYGWVIMSL